MKITGSVYSIGDLEVFSIGKRKRSIVISTYETVVRYFEIHFYDENIEQLDILSLRDRIEIKFDLQSEVFEDKQGKSYFTHIIGLEILSRKRFY